MDRSDLRVGTYNVANSTDHSDWVNRKIRVAENIRKAECDIVGLQELRFDFGRHGVLRQLQASMGFNRPSSDLEPPHQLLDLMELLPEFPYYVWAPAMKYNPLLVEGLGVLSKLPILDQRIFKLGKCKGDGNQRIMLVCRVQARTLFDFIVTHWTYSVPGQLKQAYRTLQFIKEVANPAIPQILVGDFNIKNAFQNPMFMLEGASTGYTTKGDLVDVWKHFKPHKLGKTYPVWQPKQRYDRILVRGGMLRPLRIEVVGVALQEKPEVLLASDHCFVYADFEVLQDQALRREFLQSLGMESP